MAFHSQKSCRRESEKKQDPDLSCSCRSIHAFLGGWPYMVYMNLGGQLKLQETPAQAEILPRQRPQLRHLHANAKIRGSGIL